jgi:hypothetical protein
MHWGNILVHNVGHPVVLHYRLRGKDYYVPSPNGNIYMLWDFEMSYVLGKTRTHHLTESEMSFSTILDYYRVSKIPDWCIKEGYEIEYPYTLIKDIDECARQMLSVDVMFESLFSKFLEVKLDVYDSFDLHQLPNVLANEHIFLLNNIIDVQSSKAISFTDLREITMKTGDNTDIFKKAIISAENYSSGKK